MSLSKGDFSADHSENRKKVCAACGKKCKDSMITDLSSGQIKTYLDPQFDLSNEHYPVILCVNCKILLNKAAKGEKVSFPEMPDYLNIAIAKETRSNPRGVWDCLICIKASQRGGLRKV